MLTGACCSGRYGCPVAGGVATDFATDATITEIEETAGRVYMTESLSATTDGVQPAPEDTSTFCATEEEATAAFSSAEGCAAACSQQAVFRHHMSERSVDFVDACQGGAEEPAACLAFLWSDGSCVLFSSLPVGEITPVDGTLHYSRNVGDDGTAKGVSGFLADGSWAGPGTCGCVSADRFEDRCVVFCESTTCVQVPDEASPSPPVLMKIGRGSCRGESVDDRPSSDLTVHQVATPADCLRLCTTDGCYGVTIEAPDSPNEDRCVTAEVAACSLASADEATCEAQSGGGVCEFVDGACRTTTVEICAPLDAAACEAAERCALESDPFTCEVWDQVEIKTGARYGQKVTLAEVTDNERYEPVRPRNQAGTVEGTAGDGQCWIPQHAVHICEIPDGDTAVTTVGLEFLAGSSGQVTAGCATGNLMLPGQHTCIECAAFFGPDPDRTDAICNPKYLTPQEEWFEAGNMACMPECQDVEEQLTQCPTWAINDECVTNPGFMDTNCPLSCRTWMKEDAPCIEPMDPDEAILRCAACPTDYYEGEPYVALCAVGSALDNTQCSAYGESKRTAHLGVLSDVARVYVENQGWRDIPLGHADDEPHLDRCEDLKSGPNFGELGVPIPPNNVAVTDRYTVECERTRKDCTSYHRSSRDNCESDNEYYLSLRLNFFMDCQPAAGEGCMASEQYHLGDNADNPRTCNRGVLDPDDPPLGFHWTIPLCKTTDECILAGAAVQNDPSSLDLFRRDCCTLETATEVEAGPDGSTTMRQLCAEATSGAGRATVPGWLRLAGAALIALMIHASGPR